MKTLLQLLRSMRFAIAILTVVAVASAIGSVLEQSQSYALYVGRYGEFWARLFVLAGLTDVYHASWFFLLLGFMASSTALCLAQHTPSMLREMRGFRENKSLQSIRQLPCSSEIDAAFGSGERLRMAGYLRARGFRFALRELDDGGYLLAARAGGLRRAGYLLVHGAIVLICIGGLIDGNVGLRLQMLSGRLQPETRNLAPDQVPQDSRLAADAGSFRATLKLAEGSAGNAAYLPLNDGYLLQELPFSVRLKRFHMDHYDNGQPKDFASDIEIIDGDRRQQATLQVNRPFTYRGVTLYQSGFDDGGTRLQLALQALADDTPAAAIDARVGGTHPLLIDGEPVSVEFTEFRRVNVFADEPSEQSLRSAWFSHGHSKAGDVGPSLAFRLRDRLGQASEWKAYMQPIASSDARYFVIGRRAPEQEALHYVRLPVDAAGGLESYRRLARALRQEPERRRASKAIAAQARDGELASALEQSTALLLERFARDGFRGISELVQGSVPASEQAGAVRLYLDLLQRAAGALDSQPGTALSARFLRDSLIAYSDSIEAKIPVFFHLTGFTQVNASILQLTRAPGALLVYLGAALLALGVCAMYFVHERRLWIAVLPTAGKLLVGYAANRPSPALPAEFEAHRAALTDLIHNRR